jgi:hypothetical protein
VASGRYWLWGVCPGYVANVNGGLWKRVERWAATIRSNLELVGNQERRFRFRAFSISHMVFARNSVGPRRFPTDYRSAPKPNPPKLSLTFARVAENAGGYEPPPPARCAAAASRSWVSRRVPNRPV